MFTHRRPGTKSHVGFFYSDFRWFFQHPCLLSCTDLFRWPFYASRERRQPQSYRHLDEWARRWWGQTQMRMRGSETQVEEMTGDWKDLGENRKNTSYNLQIYIEIMDSQKVKFVNCELMTWERIVSYTLQFTIYNLQICKHHGQPNRSPNVGDLRS